MKPSHAVRALVAIAAALALADASVVALALPPILSEMRTSVTGVAAIVGVYALVLALAIVPGERLVRALGPERAGALGLGLFALASVGCAVAPSLTPLLIGRALQAAGGAAGLLAAFSLLDAGGSAGGRRLWLGAALVGTAAGPALGGALTEALSWRAIFVVQAPIAGVAAVACVLRAAVPARERAPLAVAAEPRGVTLWRGGVAPPRPAGAETPLGDVEPARLLRGAPALPLASLALTSAAFTVVLFLLVLELVAGFAIAPLRAALGVSVLPVAALAASAIRGDATARAAAGGMLIAGGAAALALLPGASIGWAIVPQLLAGAGMGLALPAFANGLLPERTVAEAARGLLARHAGVVVILAILAPVVSAKLTALTERATLQGTAVVLDADLPPQDKLALAPTLLDGVDAQQPRGGLKAAIERGRATYGRGARAKPYDELATRLDGVVIDAVRGAFKLAYAIAAALALLGAALLIRRGGRAVALAAVAAVACVAGYAVAAHERAPPAVVLQDPCRPRRLPQSGGLDGFLQAQVLRQLDRTACRYGSTREELVLALADATRARAYERRYGVDPRSVSGLLGLLGG